MATGMVLIIVSRNIDLSVGSLLGFLGYTMALVQTDGILALLRPRRHGQRARRTRRTCGSSRSPSASLLGAVVGAAGFIVAYGGVPSFIVTLGGFLVWRGVIFRFGGKQGQTLAPLDEHLPAARRRAPRARSASGGAGWSPLLACAGIVLSLVPRPPAPPAPRPRRPPDVGRHRARRRSAARPCSPASGWSPTATSRRSPAKPTGIAYPVVILIGVTLLMTYLARRRRFGRYVYAFGGNPEAAELGGINTRRTVMITFVLMGVLCAVSAAIQTARLNAAVTNLGVQNELDVIAAAVIGGTSFAGGDRHHPRRRARRDRHAVAALGHGAAEDRLAVAGHRRRRRARHRGRHRLGAPAGRRRMARRRARRRPRRGGRRSSRPAGPERRRQR